MDDNDTKQQDKLQKQIQDCKMFLSSINPGHYFLMGSMPLLYSAYKAYYTPLDPITNEILKQHLHPTSEQIVAQKVATSIIKNTTTTITTTTTGLTTTATAASANATATATAATVLEGVEEPIRRAVGLALAGRALRIATMACTGVYCFSISLLFYGCGWTSIQDAVNGTTNWAQLQRQQIETCFGITSDNNDDNDPEIIKINQMTEDEQYDYIAKNYFSYNEEDDENDNDIECDKEKDNNVDTKTKR